MKQAWQSVASVARSTTPCSIGTSSSDEETSLITPYSVRFSCRRAHSSEPSGAGWYSLTATTLPYLLCAERTCYRPVWGCPKPLCPPATGG